MAVKTQPWEMCEFVMLNNDIQKRKWNHLFLQHCTIVIIFSQEAAAADRFMFIKQQNS